MLNTCVGALCAIIFGQSLLLLGVWCQEVSPPWQESQSPVRHVSGRYYRGPGPTPVAQLPREPALGVGHQHQVDRSFQYHRPEPLRVHEDNERHSQVRELAARHFEGSLNRPNNVASTDQQGFSNPRSYRKTLFNWDFSPATAAPAAQLSSRDPWRRPDHHQDAVSQEPTPTPYLRPHKTHHRAHEDSVHLRQESSQLHALHNRNRVTAARFDPDLNRHHHPNSISSPAKPFHKDRDNSNNEIHPLYPAHNGFEHRERQSPSWQSVDDRWNRHRRPTYPYWLSMNNQTRAALENDRSHNRGAPVIDFVSGVRQEDGMVGPDGRWRGRKWWNRYRNRMERRRKQEERHRLGLPVRQGSRWGEGEGARQKENDPSLWKAHIYDYKTWHPTTETPILAATLPPMSKPEVKLVSLPTLKPESTPEPGRLALNEGWVKIINPSPDIASRFSIPNTFSQNRGYNPVQQSRTEFVKNNQRKSEHTQHTHNEVVVKNIDSQRNFHSTRPVDPSTYGYTVVSSTKQYDSSKTSSSYLPSPTTPRTFEEPVTSIFHRLSNNRQPNTMVRKNSKFNSDRWNTVESHLSNESVQRPKHTGTIHVYQVHPQSNEVKHLQSLPHHHHRHQHGGSMNEGESSIQIKEMEGSVHQSPNSIASASQVHENHTISNVKESAAVSTSLHVVEPSVNVIASTKDETSEGREYKEDGNDNERDAKNQESKEQETTHSTIAATPTAHDVHTTPESTRVETYEGNESSKTENEERDETSSAENRKEENEITNSSHEEENNEVDENPIRGGDESGTKNEEDKNAEDEERLERERKIEQAILENEKHQREREEEERKRLEQEERIAMEQEKREREKEESDRIERERLESERQEAEREEQIRREEEDRQAKENERLENERKLIEEQQRLENKIAEEEKEHERLEQERKLEEKHMAEKIEEEKRLEENRRLEIEEKINEETRRQEETRLLEEKLERERLEEQRKQEENLAEAKRIEERRNAEILAARRELEREEEERREEERREAERKEEIRKQEEQRMAARKEAERFEEERIAQEIREEERRAQLRREELRREQDRLEKLHREELRREQERIEQDRLEEVRLEEERMAHARREQEQIEEEKRKTLEKEREERRRIHEQLKEEMRKEAERNSEDIDESEDKDEDSNTSQEENLSTGEPSEEENEEDTQPDTEEYAVSVSSSTVAPEVVESNNGKERPDNEEVEEEDQDSDSKEETSEEKTSTILSISPTTMATDINKTVTVAAVDNTLQVNINNGVVDEGDRDEKSTNINKSAEETSENETIENRSSELEKEENDTEEENNDPCSNGRHTPPPNVDHAQVTYVRSGSYLEAEYQCADGFEIRGGGRLLCEELNWLGPIPHCHKVDPCADPEACHHFCTNDNGRAVCSCRVGYKLDGDYCVDVNECLSRNGHGPCQDTCENFDGGYRCTCAGMGGMRLSNDNVTCEDINECETDNNGCSHQCINTVGSAFCLCPEGMELHTDWRTCVETKAEVDNNTNENEKHKEEEKDTDNEDTTGDNEGDEKNEEEEEDEEEGEGEDSGNDEDNQEEDNDYVDDQSYLPAPDIPTWIKCPKDVQVDLLPGHHLGKIKLDKPKISKRLRWEKDVSSNPSWGMSLQAKLPVGTSAVTYTAKDPITKQKASCVVMITVKKKAKKQVPIIKCPEDVHVSISGVKRSAKVTWNEPTFNDDVRIIKYHRTKEPGSRFSYGRTLVTYEIWDDRGASFSCSFIVHVQK